MLKELNFNVPKNLLISLKSSLEEEILQIASTFDWAKEIDDSYIQKLQLYRQTLSLFENKIEDDITSYLKNEFEKTDWSHSEQIPSNIIDDHFRLPIFKTLANMAVSNPSLFTYLEDLPNQTSGWLKRNIESLLPEYKSQFYQKNPDRLPETGYFLVMKKEPNEAVTKTIWQIQHYFQKHKKLPKTLHDLAIINGGENAYLYGDVYSNKSGKLLIYEYLSGEMNGAKYWTYILISVGPNNKLDINTSLLQLGLRNRDAETIITNKGDDIFKILTYISPIIPLE